MCDRCHDGARGEDGHAALFPYFRSGMRRDGEPAYVLYRCGMCGAVWQRRAHEHGFDWAPKGMTLDTAAAGEA